MIINDKNMAFRLDGKTYHCAMDVTMHFVGGKWKSVVLWYLRNKTLRFSELKNQIPDITEKMLSLQLKVLEKDGLISRTVTGNKAPLKVEYSLSDFGKSLLPVLEALAKWGRELGSEKGELIELKNNIND